MDAVAGGYSAADLVAFASAARRMGRFWYLEVEENNVGTVNRVLNCDGVYHADRSDWRQSAPGGLIEPVYPEPGNCRPPQSLMCGNRRRVVILFAGKQNTSLRFAQRHYRATISDYKQSLGKILMPL